MDFLNKAYAQVADLFKSMTPGARITAAMLLALIVVCLAYLFNQQISGASDLLLEGEIFPPDQMSSMQAAWGKAKLSGHTVEGGRVRVPRGQTPAYMAALAEAQALPPNFGSHLEKAMSASNPFMQKSQMTALVKHAVEVDLQTILRAMPGVENAAVVFNTSEGRFPLEKTTTASVGVVSKGSQGLDDERVHAIRYTVASAIGASPENITVTDLTAGRAYAGSRDGNKSGTAFDDKYRALKDKYESMYKNKITDHLRAYIPGVVVSVDVGLNSELDHREETVTFEAKPVAFKQRESSTTKMSEGSSPAGQPGLTAQNGTLNQPAKLAGGLGSKTSDETNQTETQNAVPTTTKSTTLAGLTPAKVLVSVLVPRSHYEKIWHERNDVAGQPVKKPDSAALTNIENEVKTSLENVVMHQIPAPTETAKDPFPRVQITTLESITPAPIEPPGFQDHAVAWLGQYWSTLGMTVLALFSLVMLRSMVRSAPEPSNAPAISQPSLSLVTEEEEPPAEQLQSARSRLKRRGATGPSLKDELAEMVREDPDTAVSILRNWIGTAS